MKKYSPIIISGLIALIAALGFFFIVHRHHASGNKPVVSATTQAAAASPVVSTTEPLPAAAPKTKTPLSSKQIPILVYHSFGPLTHPESRMQSHYRVTAGAFDDQMKYLADNHYTPITFATYVNYLTNGGTLPSKPIILTFDDGWKTQYTYALPILQKYHFVGTFFIITGYPTGNYAAYMTWDQITTLDHDGMEIASHSITHPNLTKVSPDQAKNEIVTSKKTLEDKLGHTVITFAYPEYAHNPAIMLLVKEAGYVGARAGWGSYKDSLDHIFEITSQESVNNSNPFSSVRVPDTKTP